MRSGEALNLKIKQVDLQERTILLNKTKRGKSRRVPLNEIAYETITSLIAGAEEKGTEYLFFNSKTGKPCKWLRRSYRTLMKRAGITDFKRHDLRHDAATNMVESGASLIEVRDILGHSDIRMTQRYAHAKEQGIHQAVARLAERAKKLSQICPKRRKASRVACCNLLILLVARDGIEPPTHGFLVRESQFR